jgi:hypothetical protein
MNTIQMISHDIQTRRLKLAMGLDPQIEIDPGMVRNMWNEINHEHLKAKLGSQFSAAGAGGTSKDSDSSS